MKYRSPRPHTLDSRWLVHAPLTPWVSVGVLNDTIMELSMRRGVAGRPTERVWVPEGEVLVGQLRDAVQEGREAARKGSLKLMLNLYTHLVMRSEDVLVEPVEWRPRMRLGEPQLREVERVFSETAANHFFREEWEG